jgi:hypothetical protein
VPIAATAATAAAILDGLRLQDKQVDAALGWRLDVFVCWHRVPQLPASQRNSS